MTYQKPTIKTEKPLTVKPCVEGSNPLPSTNYPSDRESKVVIKQRDTWPQFFKYPAGNLPKTYQYCGSAMNLTKKQVKQGKKFCSTSCCASYGNKLGEARRTYE